MIPTGKASVVVWFLQVKLLLSVYASAEKNYNDGIRGKLLGVVKKKKNNKANWMVSNSAKLDRRTKQHTQFGVSASNGSRDMGRTKSWRKKTKKTKKTKKKN